MSELWEQQADQREGGNSPVGIVWKFTVGTDGVVPDKTFPFSGFITSIEYAPGGTDPGTITPTFKTARGLAANIGGSALSAAGKMLPIQTSVEDISGTLTISVAGSLTPGGYGFFVINKA
jgi:hypothetical protein